MLHREVIHACRYAADVIETQAEADEANKGFQPWIDDNGVKHPIYQIGDDVDGWELIDEEEIVGLEDLYEFSFNDNSEDREEYQREYAKSSAMRKCDEDLAKVSKRRVGSQPKDAWSTAKFGFELLAPWIKEQFDIDGEPQQIREIVREKVDEILSEHLRNRGLTIDLSDSE